MKISRYNNSRKYWEQRASELRNGAVQWYVGRTDMRSFLAETGEYVHYAYSWNDSVQRVGFTGKFALQKAVLYAEKMNRIEKKENE